MNKLLETKGSKMKVLYFRLCMLTETPYDEGGDYIKSIQDILDEYRLIEVNNVDDLWSFNDQMIDGVKVCFDRNIRCDNTYVGDTGTCLCSKNRIRREFKLEHKSKNHNIILGSVCIKKYSPKHQDIEKVKRIEKKINELIRSQEIRDKIKQLIPEVTFSTKVCKDNKRELLLELAIKILKDTNLSDRLYKHFNINPVFSLSKASFYYNIVNQQYENKTLTQRNAQNVRKELIYSALESSFLNWRKN
ncbi:MAG: hypothetical protein GTO02_21240 [Candidatus Dadabacteria bacterium]|nr:hypothetical protein [Candidatus Dadabacteria bacterium]